MLYEKQHWHSRWASFENIKGEKGAGGKENQGAKGHAFDRLAPGETKVLLTAPGSGIIHRGWFTLPERQPEVLRALRLEMFWDKREEAAVSVPFGDFFGVGMGLVPFENELFASPEGRSFIFTTPMPFRNGAKITLTNEGDTPVRLLFYDINYSLTNAHHPDVLYFHAHWRRESPVELGKDFTILPHVKGDGRFLGASFSVITDPVYERTWWGEGEVKLYLDGDHEHATLVGTGTEDYIGTAWETGAFTGRYQGCPIHDNQKGWYSFYRFHVPDPVFFQQDCRATIQAMSGAIKQNLARMIENGATVKAVSASSPNQYINLLDTGMAWDDARIPDDAWINFYSVDDWATVAYFYLDAPTNGLPRLGPLAERIAGLADHGEATAVTPSYYIPQSLRTKDNGFAFNLLNAETKAVVITGIPQLMLNNETIPTNQITIVTLNGLERTAVSVTPATPLQFTPGTTLRFQIKRYPLESGEYDVQLRLETTETPVSLTFVDKSTLD
jgi:hypothetical protein